MGGVSDRIVTTTLCLLQRASAQTSASMHHADTWHRVKRAYTSAALDTTDGCSDAHSPIPRRPDRGEAAVAGGRTSSNDAALPFPVASAALRALANTASLFVAAMMLKYIKIRYFARACQLHDCTINRVLTGGNLTTYSSSSKSRQSLNRDLHSTQQSELS